MIRALIVKDLRELRPWALLSLVLGLCDIAGALTQQVDMQPLSVTFSDLHAHNASLLWLTAFAISTGITTRDQDNGTLAFLDGLPVSRSAMFFIRCGLIVLLVLLAPLIRVLGAALLHLASAGSLDRALHGELLLGVLCVQTLLVCNAVGLGALLGRLRSLTWLATGLLATAVALLTQRYPRAQLLNPLALEVELAGAQLVIDSEALLVQAGLGCAALAIAWRGFVQMGPSWFAGLPKRRAFGSVVAVLTMASLAAPLLLWARSQAAADGDEERAESDAEQPRFSPSAPARTETLHYRFSYPALRSSAALKLAADADAIYERVHGLLGADLGAVIDVDGSGSLRNTEGTAFSGRVRLVLGTDNRALLAHETSHVVCGRMVGETRSWLWERATVLNEGIATWVERQFEAGSEAVDDELVLAALHARRELLVDEFADPSRLGLLRDEDLKYPVGMALVSASVRLYGAASLTRLVRAFGDARLPSDLRGLSLWQSAFQLAGMDLGAVVDELYRAVGGVIQRRGDELAALPRPRVRLVRRNGSIGAQILLDPTRAGAREGNGLRLRFKPTPRSPLDELESYGASTATPIWRDDSEIAGGQVCVQAGVVVAQRTLYESWTCLPVRDAVAWGELPAIP
jgi:hypothetical protein